MNCRRILVWITVSPIIDKVIADGRRRRDLRRPGLPHDYAAETYRNLANWRGRRHARFCRAAAVPARRAREIRLQGTSTKPLGLPLNESPPPSICPAAGHF